MTCPNNFQGDREHQWGWCSVTSFSGGRSGTYAKCHYCQAQDWGILEKLTSEMSPPIYKSGDTVMRRNECWRYDITGMTRLDLVKVTECDAIVTGNFVSTFCANFSDPLERYYTLLCKDGDRIFERNATAEFLTPNAHGGTIEEWKAQQPKPKPYKLEDDDLALLEPRLRCIDVTFEKSHGESRCGKCNKLYEGATASVRDEWCYRAPTWREMVEQYQRNPWNSSGTGWCVKCCHELLPKTSEAYLKFISTGEFPMQKYIQSECDTCHKKVGGNYYYRSIGEDLWEVYCRECQYERQSHDLMEGGFGHMLGSSSSYIGTLKPGESVTVSV